MIPKAIILAFRSQGVNNYNKLPELNMIDACSRGTLWVLQSGIYLF